MARAHQIRGFDLHGLVNDLFPENSDTLSDLRAVALDALVEAERPGDLLRSIVEAVTQDDVPQNPDFVRVMSLHKSKGLTCGSVYMAGAIDGILPTIRETDAVAYEAAYSEGRRLFYVAVTRAAADLTISSSVSMDLADAASRGVKYDRNTIRRMGDRHSVKTISSPYLIELGRSAPRSVRGEDWLRDR